MALLLACVLGIVVVEYILEHRKIVLASGAVHIVVYGDKTDVIRRVNEILQAPHLRILPAQAGQVLDNQRGDRIVLHIFHHFLKARSLKVRTGITVVHKEHGVFEVVI